jgi:uncharacterized membrane protein
MTTLRRFHLAIAFTVAAFVAAAVSYGSLPDAIPVHWNLQGTADGWMSRTAGALCIPAVAAAIVALLIAFEPRSSASGAAGGSMQRVYPLLVASVAAFLLFMTVLAMRAGAGAQLDLPSAAAVGLGMTLAFIGNLSGKLTRNSVAGIRTPWTLRDDEVWLRTHRIGGWLLMLSGLGAAIAGAAGLGLHVAMAMVLVAAVAAVIASYLVHRQVQRERNGAQR